MGKLDITCWEFKLKNSILIFFSSTMAPLNLEESKNFPIRFNTVVVFGLKCHFEFCLGYLVWTDIAVLFLNRQFSEI